MKDHVDRILEQWDAARPDLDASPLGILTRVVRLGKHVESDLKLAIAPFGLDTWAFEVLAALRRQGEPYTMSPTALRRAAQLTSGAMTNRIDRLEEKGLVARAADPRDRRGLRVQLTPAGLALIDRALDVRFQTARDFVMRLSDREMDRLEHLLRKLLLARPEELVGG